MVIEKFECKKCGACCKNNGIVIMYPIDIQRISQKMEIEQKEFVQRYCRKKYINLNDRQLKIYVLDVGDCCPFLDENNLCTIHSVKPLQCEYGPTRYFLSVGAHRNCVQLRKVKDLKNKTGVPDEFFVKMLLEGYQN